MKKRVVDKQIVEILKGSGKDLNFTTIKKELEKGLKGKRVSPGMLSDNLKYLIEHHLVHEIKNPGKSPGSIHPTYALTENCIKPQKREIFIDAMAKIEPVNFLPATPWMEPMFLLGSEREDDNSFLSGLHSAAKSRFRFELEKILAKSDEAKKSKIKLMLAQMLWLQHLDFIEPFKKDASVHEAVQNDEYLKDRLKEEGKIKNLKQLVQMFHRRKRDRMLYGEYFTKFIFMHFPEVYARLPSYKLSLLGNVSLFLDFPEDVLCMNDQKEQIIKALNQKENQDLLSRFVNEVDQISFVLMVSIGHKQIDKLLWNEGLASFEKWMSSLKEGKLDDREGIFSKGARNVSRFMKAVKTGRLPRLIGRQQNKLFFMSAKDRTSARLLEVKDGTWEDLMQRKVKKSIGTKTLQVDKLEKGKPDLLDLLFLYEHHPRGKDADFYEEICEEICKRRKARAEVKSYSLSLDEII